MNLLWEYLAKTIQQWETITSIVVLFILSIIKKSAPSKLNKIENLLQHVHKNLTIEIIIIVLAIFFAGFCIFKEEHEKYLSAISSSDQAWVGFKNAFIQNLEAGKNLQATIIYKNSGKTPANDTKASCALAIWDAGINIDKLIARYPNLQLATAAVLFPENELTIKLSIPNITDNEIEMIKEGKKNIYIFGNINYLDIHKIAHNTKFCYLYELDTQAFKVYPQYNSAD